MLFLNIGFFLMFGLVFIIVIGCFVFIFVKGFSIWNKNNNSPRLTVNATVISKRVDVNHHKHPNAGDATGAHGFHTTITTSYYVCFQVETGDRIELHVDGKEYGMLAEKDSGRLSFQGTRYLGFERIGM